MAGTFNVVSRARGINGRFVRSEGNGRSAVALANHNRRQKAYLLRKSEMMKRLVTSFIRAFVVKEPGSRHWIPGAEKDSLLLECMENLLKESHLEPKRTRLSGIKLIYFKGDTTKKILGMVNFREKGASKSKAERVPAFVGWRFPYADDVCEMLAVNKWLKEHVHLLKVDIKEAKNICFRMFSRYEKRSGKYIYSGYRAQEIATNLSTSNVGMISESQTPSSHDHSTDDNSRLCSKCNQSIDNTLPLNAGQERTVSNETQSAGAHTDERLRGYVKEMMTVATQTSTFYKALQLALEPPCYCKFNVLCSVWMSRFAGDQPLEEWCGLERDIFEFCRLTSRGKTNTEEYRNLKQALTDQLEVFKLIRQSANLPLFEEDLSEPIE